MSRGDILREAFRRYHAREITLAQLMACVLQWRPTKG